MSRIMMRLLMRQQSIATIHYRYRVELWRGRGGLSFSISSNTPTDSGSRNFS